MRDEKSVISADESLLERGLFNLINNSIYHNKNGCKIDIAQHSANENIYISISDNGCGVNQDIIDNISDIPKSAHGLGLPMAYRIIRAHGGKFSAYSDHGFHVDITLPM